MTQPPQHERTLRELMTPVPHSVTVDHSVSEVWSRMRALGIRHLPVMHDGRVVGVVGERQMAALCEHGRADPDALAAGDVLSPGACVVVGPEMHLSAAVESMAEQKADCCAVVERGELTGILTAQDLLQLLAGMLFQGAHGHDQMLRPSEVRTRILAEHTVLRSLYATIEEHALAVLDEEPDQGDVLRECCRDLYHTLLRHIELENAVLAPALRDTDAFGPLRADQLLAEHDRQRSLLFAALDANDERSAPELAGFALQLIEELRTDMSYEEQTLLHPDLLRDDVVSVAPEAG